MPADPSHQTRHLRSEYRTVRKTLASGVVAEYHYDKVTGKRIDAKPGTVAFASAIQKLRTSRGTVTFGRGSLGSLLAAYYASAEFAGLADATKHIYRRGHSRLAGFEHLPVAELKRGAIAMIRNSLRDTPALANQCLTALSALMLWAIQTEDDEWAELEFNPVRAVKRLDGGTWKRWPEADLETFEAMGVLLREDKQRLPQDPPWTPADGIPRNVRLGFMVMLYTGQRLGDCLKMRWSDYDPSTAAGAGTIRVVQTKTARNEEDILWVPVHPRLRAALDEERQHATGLFIIADAKGRPFWAPEYGARLQRQRLYWERFNRWQIKVLGKAYPPHGLRKSAAARLAEAGCTAHEIMAVTGHRSLQQAEHYTRQADRARNAQAAMRKVGNVVQIRKEKKA